MSFWKYLGFASLLNFLFGKKKNAASSFYEQSAMTFDGGNFENRYNHLSDRINELDRKFGSIDPDSGLYDDLDDDRDLFEDESDDMDFDRYQSYDADFDRDQSYSEDFNTDMSNDDFY